MSDDILKEIRETSNRIFTNIDVLDESSVPISVFENSNKYDIVYVDKNHNTKCIILEAKDNKVLFLCESNKEQSINSHKHPKSKKTMYVIRGFIEVDGNQVTEGQEYTVEKNTLHSLKYGRNTQVFVKLQRDEN